MQTVAIHFDRDITLAEARRAAAAIGCSLQVEIVRRNTLEPDEIQNDQPDLGTELEFEEAEDIVIELPSFLRRQAD